MEKSVEQLKDELIEGYRKQIECYKSLSLVNDDIIAHQKETIQTLNQSLDETKKLLDEATELLNKALLMIES